ncbi:Inherit from meNOG: ankyrin 3, node of Ranvier (ankyrin G) [Seminavis robusta]|uniref:Inherit from meNOG: ankyrin 3, node of Ranvier (Ankyrin G) n=1 Tax=Seminavis robusta TaxID=568900 RepID=A0A9N8DY75_9STRA|nr:Inherit from meNOG: ankyrin 3, node of Ranvier (ankyrin G) [Seminavis robusta]|eukprot:Sro372_g128710.1 Inherit from meNOG: ankyrin 3, node of Ranvier (ankyrin G) (379) ;mRNA; f:14485-15715
MSASAGEQVVVAEVATEEQARDLRAAIDGQLELVRSLSIDEQLEWTVEEQLAQMVMIVSQYPEGALQQAVLMTHPPSAEEEGANSVAPPTTATFSGRLPIHLACDTNAPIEIIRWLLEHDERKESILRKDKWGDLPIHTACSRKDVEVVRLLLESDSDKSTIVTKDNTGALPIHMACRYNAPKEVIQMLLENDLEGKSLFVGGTYDQLPLHVACRCNLPPASIQPLLDFDTDKKTVLVEDNAGRLPLHVAYLRNSHMEVTRMLLEAMICGRIERLGLDLWKRDMGRIYTSLSAHERDFNANDKLEMTREALKEFIQRAFVFELGIWKASCVRGSKERCREDCEYKKERRIKSGAEIIIPHVVSFLENEPIEKLVQQLT